MNELWKLKELPKYLLTIVGDTNGKVHLTSSFILDKTYDKLNEPLRVRSGIYEVVIPEYSNELFNVHTSMKMHSIKLNHYIFRYEKTEIIAGFGADEYGKPMWVIQDHE